MQFTSQPPTAVKTTRIKLSRQLTVEQAFQTIVTNCLTQIQANEAAVTQADQVEGLHQMRVGLRRLRAAHGLFKNMLQVPDELQHEIIWLADELGIARDWDVLGHTLAGLTVPVADKNELATVGSAAKAKAQEKHEAVTAAIGSSRYTQFMLSFAHWVQARGWREAMSASDRKRLKRPIAWFADRSLERVQRRLHKRGRLLKAATPKARHRMRIAAKKARYATEFFQSFYAPGKVKPYVRALSQLQDELGWMNDAAVGDQLLKKLEKEQDVMIGTTAFMRGYLAARVEADKKTLEKLWKKFKKMKTPF